MIPLLCLICCLADGAGAPLRIDAGKDGRHVRIVAGLTPEQSAKIQSGTLPQEAGEQLLRCRLVADGKERPALLGKYEHRGSELHFVPRFPLEVGALYRVSFGKSRLDYRVPLAKPSAPALVEKIYPTADVLSANHLRFHIEFSRPMRGGQDIFDHIEILDAKGAPVTTPWLRDELWDKEGKHLVLYIHPGRIKWELLLRMLLGPVLEPEREYTLVIHRELLDTAGQKLGREYRKKFRTTAEDRVRLDPKNWKIRTPPAGSVQPLIIEFDKSLDQASLRRFLVVCDAAGKTVAGSIRIGPKERSWSFQPATGWRDQNYYVKIDPRLEDPCGNTPERPFDMDQKAISHLSAPLLRLEFTPRPDRK